MWPGRFGPAGAQLSAYQLCLLLGGVMGWAWMAGRRPALGLRRERDLWALCAAVTLGALAGARILHLAAYVGGAAPDFWTQALSTRRGISMLGAFPGVALATALFAAAAGVAWRPLLDHVALLSAGWLALGRLGCLATGCCGGRAASAESWAVRFTDPRAAVPRDWLGLPLYPVQVYEALGAALACVLLGRALRWADAGRLPPGTLASAWLVAYALLRSWTELWRADVVLLSGPGITAAQALCLLLLAAGLVLAGPALSRWRGGPAAALPEEES